MSQEGHVEPESSSPLGLMHIMSMDIGSPIPQEITALSFRALIIEVSEKVCTSVTPLNVPGITS